MSEAVASQDSPDVARARGYLRVVHGGIICMLPAGSRCSVWAQRAPVVKGMYQPGVGGSRETSPSPDVNQGQPCQQAVLRSVVRSAVCKGEVDSS